MPWDGQELSERRRDDAFGLSRGDLVQRGWVPRAITSAVRGGLLLRARNGLYVPIDTDPDLVMAAHLGGRVTCVTALKRWGVFVLEAGKSMHISVPPHATRLRTPPDTVRRHWDPPMRAPHPRALSVEPLDALLHAVLCQEPRAAVATVDSALHTRLIAGSDLDELFRRLPRRYRALRKLCDHRAESGPESLLRLMLRKLGCRFEVQVRIGGVGRVDFLVEGWLIIECDSEAHHGTWEQRRRDLRRDQAAAARGLSTYRPIAEDIMWNQDDVWAALIGLLRPERSELRATRRSRRW